MRSLELFSGQGTVSKVLSENGFETHTLDNDSIHNPSILHDILEWDYRIFPKDHFDFIWASPDCTSWSIACHKHRTIKEGLVPKTETAILGEKLIHKTIEIIKYFEPKIYIIENPRGRLRHFPPMSFAPYRTTVYYNNYGFPISKPTDLWSNKPLWEEKNIKKNTVRWSHYYGKYNANHRRVNHRSMIPKSLIEKLILHLYPEL